MIENSNTQQELPDLPSVSAFEPTNAWYNLCSLANSDLEKYFLIKLIAAESLPDTVSDATCLTSNSNNIPVFLNLLCFIFI